jgi:hypothetical protein
MNIIEKLNLPPFEPFDFEDAHAFNFWRDYYGALEIIKEYCSLNPKTTFRNFSWYHGTFPPGYNTLSILTNNLFDKNKIYFVTDKEQEQILKSNGYTKTFCIGLPIIYVKVPKVERIKDSLLIMPSHSLVGGITDNSINKGEFLDNIIDVQKFDRTKILACLHSNDIKNSFWINELKERGISYIEGAKINDKNAYHRQVSLFSQFEYMVTNDFGSHILYALFFGVKVSILDFPIEYKDIEDEVKERIMPEIGYSLKDLENLKKEKFKALYTDIKNAKQNIALGESYLGFKHKKSADEMRKLFAISFRGKVFWFLLGLRDKIHNLKLRIKNVFIY